jgi:membrane-bound lytic murein transglycosylase A
MPGARRILLALAFGALLQPAPGVAESSAQLVDFADLTGWEDDDHAAALAVFRNTCMDLSEPDWQGLCAIAETAPDARTFFELFFRPVLIGGDQRALFTGYFEPELDGSRTRTGGFATRSTAFPPRSETADG